MIINYFLSISFILTALMFSYIAGSLTINLIQKYTSDNSSNINFPIIPIGFGMISLFSNYLYFNFNISSDIIFLLILVIVILSFIFNYFFFKFKKIEFSEIIFLLIISSILIIFLLIKGEQFYIFRGNHWDSINYLSTALTIKNFNYLEIFQLRNSNIFPYESYIYTGDIIYRPLVKLILSFFLNLQIENYFFQYWIFKIFLICNIYVSCRYFLKNFSIEHSLIYSFVFIFSFWFLYIVEIDALSHLASFSFFILGISFVINNEKNKIFLDRNNEILFLLSTVLVILFYSEIFIIYIYLIFVYLFFKLGIKKIFYEIYPKKLKIILVFFILTIPTYQLTYNVIYLNLISGVKNSNVDWWGYYGAFILGKIDNFLLLDFELIKDVFFLKGINQEALTSVLNFLSKQNINHVFLNIIPSFFGLYHLTNLNINYYLNLIFTIFLNFILIKIIYINFKEFFLNKNFKNMFLTSVAFSFLTIIIITIFLRLNMWIIVKIYSYLSFFIFIFFINNNNFFVKKKFNFYLPTIIILFIISFPVYKYLGINNNGIGRIDNFPSILDTELKNKINWKINNLEIKNCALITFDNQSDQILNFLSVKLNFMGFKHINRATFKNNNELINSVNCELVLEKRSFILKDVY